MYKVFIGTEEAQWLPTEILKYSILRRSQATFEFHDLQGMDLGLNLEMYTGFSFFRFAIPQVCHFKDRALYLDADIVVRCDLEELFNHEMKDKPALSRITPSKNGRYTSVMLLDCEKLKHWQMEDWVALINAGIASYHATLFALPLGLNHNDFGDLEEYWNHLDTFDATTKIIHYTSVPTQPWKVAGHPHAKIFLDELKSALDEGVVTREQVQEQIEKGHIYPAILEDMEKICV